MITVGRETSRGRSTSTSQREDQTERGFLVMIMHECTVNVGVVNQTRTIIIIIIE